jgi:PPE-repeat protein
MTMDFGLLPPEVNSGRMYAGPGSGPMLAAAAAWDGLAGQLYATAASCESVVSGLAAEWRGPSSARMVAAAKPYTTWMSTAAGHAELTAMQAKAAASAYETAFAATVPPPAVMANRTQLMTLTATNFFGQNTPAIMATEVQYAEMWAQDAVAMYGYADQAAATTPTKTFNQPPATTDPGGSAVQTTAATEAATKAAGLSPLLATDNFLTGPFSPLELYKLPAVAELLGGQGYLLPRAAANLLGALNKSVTLPATAGPQVLASGLASETQVVTSAGMNAISVSVGRAELVGAMSVPQSWTSAAPAIGTATAAAVPQTSSAGAAAAALAAEGQGGALGNMAVASLAGQAMAGTGGGGVQTAGVGSLGGMAAADESATAATVSNIFVIPEDDR